VLCRLETERLDPVPHLTTIDAKKLSGASLITAAWSRRLYTESDAAQPVQCEVSRAGGRNSAFHRRKLAAAGALDAVLQRHNRCPSSQYVHDVPGDRCDVMSRLWAAGRAGARQHLGYCLV
jgi:hypothetical protein